MSALNLIRATSLLRHTSYKSIVISEQCENLIYSRETEKATEKIEIILLEMKLKKKLCFLSITSADGAISGEAIS